MPFSSAGRAPKISLHNFLRADMNGAVKETLLLWMNNTLLNILPIIPSGVVRYRLLRPYRKYRFDFLTSPPAPDHPWGFLLEILWAALIARHLPSTLLLPPI
jgi:hypothetical protein